MEPRMLGRLRRNVSILGVFAVTIALFFGAGIWVNGFASVSDARSILAQASILTVAAAGQTFVILGGGIDLSIPWTMTVAGIVATVRAETHDPVPTIVLVLVLSLGDIS